MGQAEVIEEPVLDMREALAGCACFNFRKASRAITRFFDECLEPVGLRSTQLSLLIAIDSLDAPSMACLAEELVLEPSTLARNVKPLEKAGLIEIQKGVGGRRKIAKLTQKGEETLQQAVPYWEKAQNAVLQHFPGDTWPKLMDSLSQAVQISNS